MRGAGHGIWGCGGGRVCRMLPPGAARCQGGALTQPPPPGPLPRLRGRRAGEGEKSDFFATAS